MPSLGSGVREFLGSEVPYWNAVIGPVALKCYCLKSLIQVYNFFASLLQCKVQVSIWRQGFLLYRNAAEGLCFW